ncbi:hypothetical protein F4819DRAFT_492483 [Hypoxylon fuscum]|nr:hypothetical protein F4819DRAFT_492483 [Hypoxylon fuscum]
MSTVKARSELAATELKKTPPDSRVETVGRLLFGDQDWQTKFQQVGDRYAMFADLEGPVGADQGYTDSPQWKHLKTLDTNWRNVVIYCSPDLEETRDSSGKLTKIHDNARSEDIDVGDILWDVKQETIVGKEYSTLAETKIDQKVGGEPAGERKKIAETITFHPLYLKEVEKKNYLLFTDDLLKKVAHPNLWRTVKSFCKKRLRKADDCTSMDALMGLEGTLHHEFFHLGLFGNWLDRPDQLEAYYWKWNTIHKLDNNPENYALLALAIQVIVEKNHSVDKNGKITAPRTGL